MHVVIVGGGFGGVKTALDLSKDRRFKITLISDKDHFLYYPALYGTATGGSHRESSALLSDIFRGKDNVKLVLDRVTSIDPGSKTVVGDNGTYHYDNAVLALGVVTTFFGIPGLAENSFGIKSLAEVQELKDHLHNELIQDRHMDKNYIVIGGGATGVELSAALSNYLREIAEAHKVKHGKIRISLVEASARVLPRMSEKASKKVAARLKQLDVTIRTNERVEAVSADDITISGKGVPSHTVIWTSGVTNHPFFKENEHAFEFAPNGRIVVDDQMLGAPHVYVIGDNAATEFTGLAQTALHDAAFISDHLKRIADKKPLKRYKAVKPPVVIPVGSNWAIVEWGRITYGGFLGSILRRIADIIGYHDVMPIGLALGAWRAQFINEEKCQICRVAQSKGTS
ncbi:hypothetical protein CYG49_00535 [Candidatus Saccharibacteria bacterium]|nr:MAG: hypothetical protein CYG49_00535 [Candidatus Saccharibacteria bacterium]